MDSVNSEYSASRFGPGKKNKRAFIATANNLAIVKDLFFSTAAFDNTAYNFCRNVECSQEVLMTTGAKGALVWL